MISTDASRNQYLHGIIVDTATHLANMWETPTLVLPHSKMAEWVILFDFMDPVLGLGFPISSWFEEKKFGCPNGNFLTLEEKLTKSNQSIKSDSHADHLQRSALNAVADLLQSIYAKPSDGEVDWAREFYTFTCGIFYPQFLDDLQNEFQKKGITPRTLAVFEQSDSNNIQREIIHIPESIRPRAPSFEKLLLFSDKLWVHYSRLFFGSLIVLPSDSKTEKAPCKSPLEPYRLINEETRTEHLGKLLQNFAQPIKAYAAVLLGKRASRGDQQARKILFAFDNSHNDIAAPFVEAAREGILPGVDAFSLLAQIENLNLLSRTRWLAANLLEAIEVCPNDSNFQERLTFLHNHHGEIIIRAITGRILTRM